MQTFNQFHKKSEKKKLLVRTDVDTSLLYGPLDEAAAYLLKLHKEHPNAELAEYWWGYEDMNIVLEEWVEETDEQFKARKHAEYNFYVADFKKREKHKAEAEDRKLYERLKKKHGW